MGFGRRACSTPHNRGLHISRLMLRSTLLDEVGYLSYSNRHADLLFELINRRHEKKSTLITTNKSFSEWSEVFPNASCVVAMIDRLVHHAEILSIQGDSYRHKEARERAAAKSRKRKSREAQ